MPSTWEKEGDIYDENEKKIDDWRVFANRIGIPANTFYKYIRPNAPKQIGDGSRGNKWRMTVDKIKFADFVLARADRGNDGLSSKEAVDMIQELVPSITRVAAWRQRQGYVLPLNATIGVLKRKTQRSMQPQAKGQILMLHSSTAGIAGWMMCAIT